MCFEAGRRVVAVRSPKTAVKSRVTLRLLVLLALVSPLRAPFGARTLFPVYTDPLAGVLWRYSPAPPKLAPCGSAATSISPIICRGVVQRVSSGTA